MKMAGLTPHEVDIAYCDSILQSAAEFDRVVTPLYSHDFSEGDCGLSETEPRREFLQSCISNAGATADDESMAILRGMMDDDMERACFIEIKMAEFGVLLRLLRRPAINLYESLRPYELARKEAKRRSQDGRFQSGTADRERCRTRSDRARLSFVPFEYSIVDLARQLWISREQNGRLTPHLRKNGSIVPTIRILRQLLETMIFKLLDIKDTIAFANPRILVGTMERLKSQVLATNDRAKTLWWYRRQIFVFGKRMNVYVELYEDHIKSLMTDVGHICKILDMVALAREYTRRRQAAE